MKLKKILAVTMALATALAVAACGGEKAPEASATTGTGTTPAANGDAVTVGLTQFAPHASLDNVREGFIEGMKQSGYVEGENVTYDVQNAQADTAMAAQIANTYASKKVDLICAIATPSAMAAYNEGSKSNIPVIFSAVSDPVAAELVKSLEKPETGVTGTSDVLPIRAQLQMIRLILPDAKKIGIIYTTSEANSVSHIATYKELAGEFGFEIVEQGVSSGSEVAMAADTILGKVDCITNLTDNTVVTNLSTILDKANAAKIPVFGSEEEQVVNGCLAAMGIDYFELGVETGKMAAAVLNGEDINTMAVKEFSESKPFVNMSVAEKLQTGMPAEINGQKVINVLDIEESVDNTGTDSKATTTPSATN